MTTREKDVRFLLLALLGSVAAVLILPWIPPLIFNYWMWVWEFTK